MDKKLENLGNKHSQTVALTCCSVIGIAFLAFIFIIATTAQELTPEESLASKKETAAYVCTVNEVEENLVSPSTSDFPLSMVPVLGNDGETYVISSYVDSENSFGATIRTDFGCFVKVIDADTYTCETECAFE